MKKYILAVGLAASTLVSASTSSVYGFSGGLSYSNIAGMMSNDGQTAAARLALTRQCSRWGSVDVGMELGVQTGNHMRLSISAADEANLGGTAVQTTVSSLVDLLVTAERSFGKENTTGVFIKGGLAYRSMHFDRDTVNSLREINPELQAGFTFVTSDHTSIALGYQGIFSGSVGLTTVAAGTGTVNNIPSQHGALLVFNYHT